MIYEKEFQAYGYNDIVGYSGKHITDEMIDSCMTINKKFYAKDFVFDDSIKDIVKKYNQMCFVFQDKSDNSIMGYSFWFPIKTKVFNAFIQNNQTLQEFRDSFFSSYKEESVNLFLASEAYVLGYDIKELHKAIEDVFQKRILDLAYNGIMVKYVAMESRCKFDEQFLVKNLGLTLKDKKEKSTFYYDKYSPYTIYSDSKFASGLYQYYKKKQDS